MPSPAHVEKLLAAARAAAQQAYAPYSQFSVGAALLLPDERILTGCNVENASFGLTICAERNAVTRSIAEGVRCWKALVVVSPTGVSPCGACRQFLSEFAPNLEIWFGHLDPQQAVHGPVSLCELLPSAMRFPH